MNLSEQCYQWTSRYYRRRRFAFVESLLARVPKPYRILDVGGTPRFYLDRGFKCDGSIRITLLNESIYDDLPVGFESVVGDGRDLSRYETGSFDVVHSNSVLTYLGGTAGRRQMAAEIQRAIRSDTAFDTGMA